MRRLLILTLLILVTAIPVGAADVIAWNGGWPKPSITVNGQIYYLDQIDSGGMKILTDLYRDDPELLRYLENAKTRGKWQAILGSVGTGMVGTDVALMLVNIGSAGTLSFVGGIVLIGIPYVFPYSHYDIIRQSVDLYNERHRIPELTSR